MKPCAAMNVAITATALLAHSACGGGAAEPAAPETSTAPADAAGPGRNTDTRTTEKIAAIIKANREPARACYDKVLKDKGDLRGNVVVRFIVTPRGEVKHAELNAERSTLIEPAVVNCVIDVIRSLEFPKSSRGMESKVNYPFNFNP